MNIVIYVSTYTNNNIARKNSKKREKKETWSLVINLPDFLLDGIYSMYLGYIGFCNWESQYQWCLMVFTFRLYKNPLWIFILWKSEWIYSLLWRQNNGNVKNLSVVLYTISIHSLIVFSSSTHLLHYYFIFLVK